MPNTPFTTPHTTTQSAPRSTTSAAHTTRPTPIPPPTPEAFFARRDAADLFWAAKPEEVHPLDWLFDRRNDYALPKVAGDLIHLVERLSGKIGWTFFKRDFVLEQLGIGKTWYSAILKLLRTLGIIERKRTKHGVGFRLAPGLTPPSTESPKPAETPTGLSTGQRTGHQNPTIQPVTNSEQMTFGSENTGHVLGFTSMTPVKNDEDARAYVHTHAHETLVSSLPAAEPAWAIGTETPPLQPSTTTSPLESPLLPQAQAVVGLRQTLAEAGLLPPLLSSTGYLHALLSRGKDHLAAVCANLFQFDAYHRTKAERAAAARVGAQAHVGEYRPATWQDAWDALPDVDKQAHYDRILAEATASGRLQAALDHYGPDLNPTSLVWEAVLNEFQQTYSANCPGEDRLPS